jgi:hypothetical protein
MAGKKEKQWTVMVYLAGDNNLDSAGVADLKEMKKVGSTEGVNVIAQFDRQGEDVATNRYYIRKGGSLKNDVVGSLGETNTGDPRVLEGFIQWGVENYPARHYLLVAWNHGNGWNDENVYRVATKTLNMDVRRRGTMLSGAVSRAKGEMKDAISMRRIRVVGGKNFRRALFSTSIAKAVRRRGIAYDDHAQDFLDNIEMKRLLLSAKKRLKRKIDILGMDACLMSMAEVNYQLRDAVLLTVGSEEVEPGDGWPYDRVLYELVRKPTMMPQDLAALIVKKYVDSYPSTSGVTQSACDLMKSDQLAKSVDRLARALSDGLSESTARVAIVDSRLQAQSYDTPDYVDLYDFCDLLEAKSGVAGIKAPCQRVKKTIRPDGVVISSGYKGAAVKHSNGLSIYFPLKSISPLYRTLDFTKKTAWGKFLQAYVSFARRPGGSGSPARTMNH